MPVNLYQIRFCYKTSMMSQKNHSELLTDDNGKIYLCALVRKRLQKSVKVCKLSVTNRRRDKQFAESEFE